MKFQVDSFRLELLLVGAALPAVPIHKLFFLAFKVLHCLQSLFTEFFLFIIKVGLLAVSLLLTLLQAVVRSPSSSSRPS